MPKPSFMKRLLPFLLLSFFISSCRLFGGERIRGNGNIVTVQRTVGAFNSIEAGGAVQVRIKQEATNGVRVEADENLLDYLEVYTEGNTLVIETKDGYNLNPTRDVVVYASAPRFQALDISGASQVQSEGTISGDELELGASGASEIRLDVAVSKLQANLSGSSTLQLKGTAARFATEASGASKIRCIDLTTDETVLDVSGSSDAAITVNKQLNIDASGASSVEYRGNPSINQNSSGASSVRKIS